MRRRLMWWTQAAFLSLLLPASVACAWESGPSGEAGPGKARQEWNASEPGNEHAQLLRLAMMRAGISPDFYSRTRMPSVFTDRSARTTAGLESVKPVDFRQATGVANRPFNIAGFAGLPDHSYALWDWASGNETCPAGTVVGTVSSGEPPEVSCHTFQTHIGLLNSTHFLPQAQQMYSWYHGLALQRAQACKALREAFATQAVHSSATELALQMVEQCEDQALSLEAVGQHYLQDAWAMGHMWERWGGPTFPLLAPSDPENSTLRHFRAIYVGAVAGLIHGSDALFVARGLPAPGDEMSHGDDPNVEWADHGVRQRGTGDLYLAKLLSDDRYAAQRERLLDCSALGLHQVFSAALGVQSSLPSQVSDPAGEECFGQRATNLAMLRGLGPVADLPGSSLMSTIVPTLTLGTPTSVPAELDDLLRATLVRMTREWQMTVLLDPHGTQLSAARPSLLGVKPNSNLTLNPPAPYSDPRPGSEANPAHIEQPQERSRWLARLFHRAHVADWCEDAETAPAALQQRAIEARGDHATTAIAACEEFVQRHVRIGNSPSVCEAATGRSQSASFTDTTGATTIAEAAKAACGSRVTRYRFTILATQDDEHFQFFPGNHEDVPQIQINNAGTVAFKAGGVQGSYVYTVDQSGTLTRFLTGKPFYDGKVAYFGFNDLGVVVVATGHVPTPIGSFRHFLQTRTGQELSVRCCHATLLGIDPSGGVYVLSDTHELNNDMLMAVLDAGGVPKFAEFSQGFICGLKVPAGGVWFCWTVDLTTTTPQTRFVTRIDTRLAQPASAGVPYIFEFNRYAQLPSELQGIFSTNSAGDVAYGSRNSNFGTRRAIALNNVILATSDGPYNHFEDAKVGEDRRVIFAATTDDGRSGIFKGPNPNEDAIVLLGDPVLGTTIQAIGSDVFSATNIHGQFAFSAGLADGRHVLIRADPIVE